MKKSDLLYFLVLIVFQFKAVGENYYEFLGISSEASQEEIILSFRRFAQKWHPDKNDDVQSSEMFKKGRNIYEVLSDPYKKKMYDLSLKENLSEEISEAKNFEDGHILSIEEFLAKYPATEVRKKVVNQITNLEQLEIVMKDPDPQVRSAVVYCREYCWGV